jgi:putative solute:sodium symporter small subunit
MPTDQRSVEFPLPPAQPLAAPAAVTMPGAPAIDDAGAAAQRQLALLAARSRHWQRTRRLTFVLLAAWLAATFCSVFFARELAGLSLFGWPLSFYLAAQGAALIYLAILGAYAAGMRRFDRRYAHELRHEVGNAPGQTARGGAP